MAESTTHPLPRLVPYRRVLYAERIGFYETRAGQALMAAMVLACCFSYMKWIERHISLDPRVEIAGLVAVVTAGAVGFGRYVQLQVVVDHTQVLLDVAGLRRRLIAVEDIASVRTVRVTAEELRDRDWRRRNGWSVWYSGMSGVVLEPSRDERLLVASDHPGKLRDAILHAAESQRTGEDAGPTPGATRSPLPP